jgi:sigma-B regulation protein RsbU (phosphoserine phosphatase)
MRVSEQLRAVYRACGAAEKLFAMLLAGYLAARWAAPSSLWSLLAGLALTVTGVVVAARWARRGIRAAVWKLRNRLIVAYQFIAVVPVALILLLVAIGCYLLTAQIAVYLVTSELEERTAALVAPARELLATPPAERTAHMRWMAQAMARRFPNAQVVLRDRDEWRYPEDALVAFPPGSLDEGSGLIRRDDQIYMWAHARSGQRRVFLMVPLTASLLGDLVPGLGDVRFVHLAPLTGGQSGALRPRAAPSQPRGSRVPSANNWFDIQVTWYTVVPTAQWEDPGRTNEAPIAVISRPSAIIHTIFSQRGDPFQGMLGYAFLVVAILLLVVELIALVIGVSMTRTITGAVESLYEGTQRVMRGDFAHRIQVKGHDQLAELGHSFNQMTVNLERLLRVEKEQQKLQSELEIAREVQSQLYPKVVPEVEGLELAGHCHPARTVSGDYYDYLALSGSRLAVAIGDVAGKGISAALLMATVQSSLRTQIRACLEGAAPGRHDEHDGMSAARLGSQLNQQLYAFTSAEKYATFYLGVFDCRTGRLHYTNAGHPPPIVIRNGSVIRLETNGMVVGAFPFAEYGESTFDLEPGDLLACFTDGLTEPENEYGEMFGEERLAGILQRNARRPAGEIIEEVYSAVRQWGGAPDAQDDMTMVLARRL